MTTHTFIPAVNNSYTKATRHQSILSIFTAWCGAQQKNRMLWQAMILALHGCILTPITMLFSLQAGAGSFLWIPVIVAMAINLVPNLAALSTRITIPVFLLSVLIDLAIIIAALM